MRVLINNKEIEVEKGSTILEAAKKLGIKIPTLCHIDGLFPSGACRMCVVEVEGWPRLVTSCSTEVQDGMKVRTHSPKVLESRKVILELLLANHPDECLYCSRSGQCELQGLSEEFGIRDRAYTTKKQSHHIDTSSPSILRDPSKCILCGRCVRVCEEVQKVSAIDFVNRGAKANVAPEFDDGLNVSSCINCGQCILACPTGALSEKNNLNEVLSAINDPEKIVVIQHAPSISVTIGEYFKFEEGTDVANYMNAGLRQAGFDYVFDTSFSADLTIMEEASELVERVTKGGALPMMTSCSPGWIKYVEQEYPELIPHLSTCKSPQQMLGAVIKSYFAQKQNIDPEKIYSVSAMPCTAKKFESGRKEMMNGHVTDVDAALTTRELAKLFKMLNIDLKNLEPEEADTPFGERSSAGKLFGATGGVMEAAIRTAHYMITGKDLEDPIIPQARELDGVKEITVNINGSDINFAVVSGIGNVQPILEDIKNGKSKYTFIEVMTCPGGCISGGGQPHGVNQEKVRNRMKALYDIDANAEIRFSHKNESIKKLYDEFLGKPLGHKSHELLHTSYRNRKEPIESTEALQKK